MLAITTRLLIWKAKKGRGKKKNAEDTLKIGNKKQMSLQTDEVWFSWSNINILKATLWKQSTNR